VTGGFTVAVWVGNFDGRPMEGVSGVAGAGPLLHRATLLAARRHPPGALPTPERVGARPVTICRLSGLRAGAYCPPSTEWLLPGAAELHECDWHRSDGVRLPPQYSDWAATVRMAGTAGDHSPRRAAADTGSGGFRITSPAAGDVYRFVPGVDRRYASIGLRASGGAGPVRWWVDDAPIRNGRLPLVPGKHRIRARSGGASAEVVIDVVGSP